MQYIKGISRHQLQISSLEDTISADNPIRFIEAFVNYIDCEKLGFQPKVLKSYADRVLNLKRFSNCIYMGISMEFALPEDSKKSVFAISRYNMQFLPNQARYCFIKKALF
jgi:hypothetical protein